MSLHISAKEGEIAETVLLPGDPLRARFIADELLEDAKCYNRIRGMDGYTGFFQGKRVSVQGTGMGMPSLAIYVHELIHEYGVKNLIRIGSCGAMQEEIALRDLVIAMGACTDSSFNFRRFEGLDFAPIADWELLSACVGIAKEKGFRYHVGNVFSTDQFYSPPPPIWKQFAAYQVLAVEMESAALFTLAAQHGVSALAILTVSDHLMRQEALSAEEREKGFYDMATLGLSLAARSRDEGMSE